jgi:hypothetical protein
MPKVRHVLRSKDIRNFNPWGISYYYYSGEDIVGAHDMVIPIMEKRGYAQEFSDYGEAMAIKEKFPELIIVWHRRR